MFKVRQRIAHRVEGATQAVVTRLMRRLDGLSLGQQLEAHPWRVLGTAAAIGVVLGRAHATASADRGAGLAGGVLDDATRHLVRSAVSTVSAAVAAALVRELTAWSLHRRPATEATGPAAGVTVYPRA